MKCGAQGATSIATLIAMMFLLVSVSVAQDINGLHRLHGGTLEVARQRTTVALSLHRRRGVHHRVDHHGQGYVRLWICLAALGQAKAEHAFSKLVR